MRLIDADVLLEKMKKTDRYFNIKFDIEDAPTVDAVEVVRCKDCKWWWKEWETCTHNNLVDGYTCATTFKADSFCSYGEMKKNS